MYACVACVCMHMYVSMHMYVCARMCLWQREMNLFLSTAENPPKYDLNALHKAKNMPLHKFHNFLHALARKERKARKLKLKNLNHKEDSCLIY